MTQPESPSVRAWIDWDQRIVVVEGSLQVHLDATQAIEYGLVMQRLGEELLESLLPKRTLSFGPPS